MCRELVYRKDVFKNNITSIFIGGGTPSSISSVLIEKLLSTVYEHYHLENDAEITLESNPGTLTREKLLAYKNMGINRISMGLQSCDNDELKMLGRIHTFEQFLENYNLAREVGFDNINIDIMQSLPFQTMDKYKKTLEQVIALRPEHISSYSLIIEEGTPLYSRNDLLEYLPDEDTEREIYYLTNDLLLQNGYHHYEISNYALDSRECKHNIGYWQRKEYLGFGIGAASLYKENRYNNISDINKYIEVLTNNIKENSINNVENSSEVENQVNILNSIVKNLQQLTERDRMEEFMFLGLRMMEGVSMEKFERYFGKPYMEVYGKVQKKMEDKRFLINDNGYVKLTEFGIDLSNYVMSEFLF